MSKKELRRKYKNLRGRLTLDERDALSLKIANQVLNLTIWDYNYYHIFLPINRLFEINTEYILSILSGKDKNILLSKSNFSDNTMQHILLTDSTKISVNAYGIPEPEDGIEISKNKIDVVFIPLLAYDTTGNRVGYGKGFYDRFLAACKPEVIKVGLSYFDPEVSPIAVNNEDIRLDYCVLPDKILSF